MLLAVRSTAAAGPGARPKQRNLNKTSEKTQESKSGKKSKKCSDSFETCFFTTSALIDQHYNFFFNFCYDIVIYDTNEDIKIGITSETC